MAIAKPFNLNKWIEDNRDFLKPPVANKNLYVVSEDYIVMIVAGPNARKIIILMKRKNFFTNWKEIFK